MFFFLLKVMHVADNQKLLIHQLITNLFIFSHRYAFVTCRELLLVRIWLISQNTTESQNIWSWKGPTRIIELEFQLRTELLKIQTQCLRLMSKHLNSSSLGLYVYPGLHPPRRRIQHLLSFNFLQLVITQPSNLSRSPVRPLCLTEASSCKHLLSVPTSQCIFFLSF